LGLIVITVIAMSFGVRRFLMQFRETGEAPAARQETASSSDETPAGESGKAQEAAFEPAASSTIASEPSDQDQDGLPDASELALGTDPAIKDTDNDFLSDGEEADLYRSNPLNPDTDGDGFKDGEEVRGGFNPLGTGNLPGLPSMPKSSWRDLDGEAGAYKVSMPSDWSRHGSKLGASPDSAGLEMSLVHKPLAEMKSLIMSRYSQKKPLSEKSGEIIGAKFVDLEMQKDAVAIDSVRLVPMGNSCLFFVHDKSDRQAADVVESLVVVPDNSGRYAFERDSDNDGLYDLDEYFYGSDPRRPDSDQDGFPDAAEVKNGYNPAGAGKLKK
jgi:hypothetical protein